MAEAFCSITVAFKHIKVSQKSAHQRQGVLAPSAPLSAEPTGFISTKSVIIWSKALPPSHPCAQGKAGDAQIQALPRGF